MNERMNDQNYDTIESAIGAIMETLKATPHVPTDYCQTCMLKHWPTKRTGTLNDVINSLAQRLRMYNGVRYFRIEEIIDRGWDDPVKGGVCLTVFFQQHCTQFFVCPSGEVCYACGPEDWY